RACGTSLETVWQIALKVHTGAIALGIAGGVDTNSDMPVEIVNGEPRTPTVGEPRTGLSMGQHCERMVKEWKIPREAQDALALASHHNAAKAYAAGFFDGLVDPF